MDKGSSFEREVSRILSLWWSNNERDDVFWRNRTRITSKTPNAERQLGDLIAIRNSGMVLTQVFNIEVKRGYSKTKKGKKVKNIPWDLLDLIDGKQHTFLDFWEQTTTDAAISERLPMLIFKRDYHVPVVVIRKNDLNKFKEFLGKLPDIIRMETLLKGGDVLQLFNLEEFLSWFDPDIVKIYGESIRKGE